MVLILSLATLMVDATLSETPWDTPTNRAAPV